MKPSYRFSLFASFLFVFSSLFWLTGPTELDPLIPIITPIKAVSQQPEQQLEDLASSPAAASPSGQVVDLPVTAPGAYPFPAAVMGQSREQSDAPPSSPALIEIVSAPPHSPGLLDFIVQVANGQAQELRGVYVEDVLALPVLKQPDGNPMFVSEEMGTVTQFQSAAKYGVAGLLAHNYLSGDLFFSLALGQQVSLVYGDGQVVPYQVTDIQRYEKLQRNSANSNYLNVETGKELTTRELFQLMYTASDRVTFQTCIKKAGDWSWGRIFITATALP
jgi:hypothetical protein